MEWNKVSEKEIPFGEEVIAFNKELYSKQVININLIIV